MKAKFLCFLAIAAFLMPDAHAQSTRNHRAKGMKGRDVDTLMAFLPVADVQLLDAGEEGEFSDSLSGLAATRWLEPMQANAHRMRLGPVFNADAGLQARLDAEIRAVNIWGNHKQFSAPLLPTPAIDSVAASLGMRYVLLPMITGFVRSTDNYRQADRKAAKTTLLSLGLVYSYAVKAQSLSMVTVLDTKEHRIIWYADHLEGNGNYAGSPVSSDILKRHWQALFEYFYWRALD